MGFLAKVEGKLAPASDLLAIEPKDEGEGNESDANKCKQRGGPVDTKPIIEICSEHRKASCHCRSDEGVDGDSTVGVEKVYINHISDTAHKDEDDTKADEDTRDDLGCPVSVGVRSPSEPEKANREDQGASDHGRETIFGVELARSNQALGIPSLGETTNDGAGKDDTDEDGDEGQRSKTRRPATVHLEADGVGFERQVQDTIDQTHVESQNDEDGLLDNHHKRLHEILVHNGVVVEGVLFTFRVQSPVLGLMAKFVGLPSKQDRFVGLGSQQVGDDGEESRHDESDPSGPSPAKIAVGDERTNDRTGDRTCKDSSSEDTRGHTTVDGFHEVDIHATNDCQRSRACNTTEKSADEDCLQVLGHCDGNLKDTENDHASE